MFLKKWTHKSTIFLVVLRYKIPHRTGYYPNPPLSYLKIGNDLLKEGIPNGSALPLDRQCVHDEEDESLYPCLNRVLLEIKTTSLHSCWLVAHTLSDHSLWQKN